MTARRITEDGDYRITEGGDYRILEGPEIGQVNVSSPAGSGTVSTNSHAGIGAVSVAAPAASAVGYTSAEGVGSIPLITVTPPPTINLTIGQNFSVALPGSVVVSPIETDAGGGAFALFPIPGVVTRAPAAASTGAGSTSVGIPTGLTVSAPETNAGGDSLAISGLGTLTISVPVADPSAGVDFDPDVGTVGVSTPLGYAEVQGSGDIGYITVTGIEGAAEPFNYAEGEIATVTISVPRVSTGKRIKVAEALFRGLENFDAIRQIKKS